jgi:hypothetical protein
MVGVDCMLSILATSYLMSIVVPMSAIASSLPVTQTLIVRGDVAH